MNNKINKIISITCLAMLVTFIVIATVLAGHQKVGDTEETIYKPTVSTTATTTTSISTTTTSTTITTTISTTESTTTTETAAYIAAPSIEFPEDVTYQELTNITVVETYTEAVNYEQPEPATEESIGYGVYMAPTVCDKVTYYGNYGYAAVGASGNQLITGYSCACDLYPFGTILYISTSDGAFSGYVRVDDRVSESGNSTVVDIYYESYDMVPYSMYSAGAYTTYYINEWHPTCQIYLSN